MFAGLLKIRTLGSAAHSAFVWAVYGDRSTPIESLAIAFYAYPAYLYFNFSGYTDVMIGVAGLLGFRLPENFNRPYRARNVLDFWDRWHISLTHWIRDYIFMAGYKSAATKFPAAARYWSYGFLFLALFLAGVWHGTGDQFAIFGALNGLGVVVARGYGEALRAILGRVRFHAYLHHPVIRRIAVLATLHYVCFCHLFFSMNIYETFGLIRAAFFALVTSPSAVLDVHRMRLPYAAIAVALISIVAASRDSAAMGRFFSGLGARVTGRRSLIYGLLCAQTALVVFILFIDWAYQEQPPPVLYMAF